MHALTHQPPPPHPPHPPCTHTRTRTRDTSPCPPIYTCTQRHPRHTHTPGAWQVHNVTFLEIAQLVLAGQLVHEKVGCNLLLRVVGDVDIRGAESRFPGLEKKREEEEEVHVIHNVIGHFSS